MHWKRLLSIVTLLSALACAGASHVEAQNTRAQQEQLNDTTFQNCDNQCITGLMVNGYESAANTAMAFINDVNIFSKQNKFTVPFIVPGTGYMYGNGPNLPITFRAGAYTLPPPSSAGLGGIYSVNPAPHQWVAYIDSSGVQHLIQPSFADISGVIDPSQLPVGTSIDGVNIQTANYTIQASDCGKTILAGTGSTGFFTITAPGVATFTQPCTVTVVNGDTGRGKKLANFPAISNPILWPRQSIRVAVTNGAWSVLSSPGRWRLPGGITWNVDPAGSDSNDGLALGPTGAFQHIQAAIIAVAQNVDANMQPVVIQPKCGGTTWHETVQLYRIVGAYDGGGMGSAVPTLLGDTTTPSNCVLDGVAVTNLLGVGVINQWIITGFRMTSSVASCVIVDKGSWIRAGVMEYGNCNGNAGNHIAVENGATYEVNGNHTITAGACAFIFSTLGGNFLYGNGAINLVGSPAFGCAFVYGTRNSFSDWTGASISGGATGMRYYLDTGAGANTNGGGTTFFPGTIAGVVNTPAWYN